MVLHRTTWRLVEIESRLVDEGPYTTVELTARINELVGDSWHWAYDLCFGGTMIATSNDDDPRIVAKAMIAKL